MKSGPMVYEKSENQNVTMHPTVLQNRVNPKSNAPEISKGATKLERNFQRKSEISQKSNDIRLRKVIFKVNLL